MRARSGSVAALAACSAVLLAGCSTTVSGTAVPPPRPPTPATVTVVVPPSSGTSPSAPSSSAPTPAPTTSAAPSGPIAIPDNGNGYTFVETRSGRTRCRVSTTGAGCQLVFDKPAPKTESGDSANGVNVGRDGVLTYVLGDIGVANPATLDYATYTARGWTIAAAQDRTTFTNDATGHGMIVSTGGAHAF